jgi:hypothetical protein
VNGNDGDASATPPTNVVMVGTTEIKPGSFLRHNDVNTIGEHGLSAMTLMLDAARFNLTGIGKR